jgi:hypothetical protein
MTQVQNTGARLEKERGQHEEVVAADKREFQPLVCSEELLEAACHSETSETGTQHYDTYWKLHERVGTVQ